MLDPNLADHVDQSVEAIAKVHREHAREASLLQRLVDSIIGLVARPLVIGVGAVCVVGWIVWNTWTAHSGGRALDPPPFAWLGLLACLTGVGLAMLILATQRRENELDERRSQLVLELALVNEHKTAKLISLLEELRRDTPSVVDRPDAESDAMSRPTDPQTMLAEIQRRSASTPDAVE